MEWARAAALGQALPMGRQSAPSLGLLLVLILEAPCLSVVPDFDLLSFREYNYGSDVLVVCVTVNSTAQL